MNHSHARLALLHAFLVVTSNRKRMMPRLGCSGPARSSCSSSQPKWPIQRKECFLPQFLEETVFLCRARPRFRYESMGDDCTTVNDIALEATHGEAMIRRAVTPAAGAVGVKRHPLGNVRGHPALCQGTPSFETILVSGDTQL